MHITQINMYGGKLAGTLPTTFGDMSYLTYIDLSRNKMHGAIPSSFSKLTSLRQLYFGNNDFTGVIPDSLSSSFGNMSFCNMAGNTFSCPLPKGVATNCKATCSNITS